MAPTAPRPPSTRTDGRGDGAPSPEGAGSPPSWRVEPAPDGRGAPPQERPPVIPRNRRKMFTAVLLGLLALNLVLAVVTGEPEKSTRVPYEPFFLDQVRAGNVEEISSEEETIQGRLKRKAPFTPEGEDAKTVQVDRFDTQVPAFVQTDELTKLLDEKNVVTNARPPDSGRSLIGTILLGFGPTLLLVGLFIWLMRRASAGGALGSFGRSSARRVTPDDQARVTFQDVAGIDEAENELVEIVDFLKNPQRYQKLGARVPRGVLLSGPPGTGKTLLARAVAGEAEAPFFSMAASEFVEAIVGVGASRVRDLFKTAKEAAPSIIFVDEIDAIGRSRSAGGGFSGGHDEREQTLNQILSEMDGFEADTRVIVLAATNRPEILDPALLRPGRFDRRITVPPPDRNGRLEILRIHTRSVPLDDEVDLPRLASSTPGMTGADLALLVNEAALFAARRGHARVEMADFTDAIEKIILGTERAVVMQPRDRERTAYHESGHALVGMLTPGADPVRKVSIIPRGQALGVTLSTPEADRYGYEREELRGRIKVMLGGRAAERVVYGEITTGAESDLQQLTQIARGMVGRWGMSEAVGPVTVAASGASGPLLPGAQEVSEKTQELVDAEVRRLVEEAEVETIALLERERHRLEALARALLERETLDQADAYRIAGVEPPPEVEAADDAASRPGAPAPTGA
jgi:cell division protease FtsH